MRLCRRAARTCPGVVDPRLDVPLRRGGGESRDMLVLWSAVACGRREMGEAMDVLSNKEVVVADTKWSRG